MYFLIFKDEDYELFPYNGSFVFDLVKLNKVV